MIKYEREEENVEKKEKKNGINIVILVCFGDQLPLKYLLWKGHETIFLINAIIISQKVIHLTRLEGRGWLW